MNDCAHISAYDFSRWMADRWMADLADARAALADAIDEKWALRNRLVAEIAQHIPGDLEARITLAEAKVIEFEDTFRAAMRRRVKPQVTP